MIETETPATDEGTDGGESPRARRRWAALFLTACLVAGLGTLFLAFEIGHTGVGFGLYWFEILPERLAFASK